MVVTLYLPAFLMRTYGFDPVTVAPLLALTAVGALAGGVGGGFVADRFDRASLSAATLALSGLFALAVFLWPLHPSVSVAAGFGFGLLDAAGRPSFIALLLGLTDRHRGAINGLYALSNQLGWALGAALGGLLLGQVGYGGLGQPALAFALAAAGLIVLARSAARPSNPLAPARA
jgi:predicted MFS family arabinose efflux permease